MNKAWFSAFRNFLVGAGIGLALLLLVGAGWYLYTMSQGRAARPPVVLVESPRFGDEVGLQQTTIVRATASDLRGITRVELWIDDQLLAAHDSQLPGGSHPFPIVEPWRPTAAGGHLLVVRAYNRYGTPGQATVWVRTRDELPTSPKSYEIQEGDTLASIASAHGLAPEAISEANPGLGEPLTPGGSISLPLPDSSEPEGAPPSDTSPPEPLPGEGPPEPLGSPPVLSLRRLLRSLPLPGSVPSGRWLEIEARSLEVGDDYDGVYCYLALNDSEFERVPAAGYLEGLGERLWSIEGTWGGERRRVIVLPAEAEALKLRGRCLGYRASSRGGEIFDLGALEVRHAEGDWDGRELDARAEGLDGWFRIGYTIRPTGGLGPPPAGPSVAEGEPGEIPAPVLTHGCDRNWDGPDAMWQMYCQLQWSVPSDARGVAPWVDGFILLRNGAIYEQIPARGPWMWELEGSWSAIAPTIIDEDGTARVAAAFGDLPSPGETYEFQVVAYRGDPFADPPAGVRSPRSNAVTITGEAWPGSLEVTVTFRGLYVSCIWSDRDSPWLATGGLGSGPPFDSLGLPSGHCTYDSSGDPEDWGPGAYGGVNVNGERVVNIHYPINTGGRYYFPPAYGYRASPSITLRLSPFASLVVHSQMWDYDVWSPDDSFCAGRVDIPPSWLQRLHDEGYVEPRVDEYAGGDGICYWAYDLTVR